MTVTIELPPEVEAGLLARAEAKGLGISRYLEALIREQVSIPSGAEFSPMERAMAWRESVRDLPHTPPLSDEAIRRESIYGGHG